MNPVDKHLAEQAEKYAVDLLKTDIPGAIRSEVEAFIAGALSEREALKGKLREVIVLIARACKETPSVKTARQLKEPLAILDDLLEGK